MKKAQTYGIALVLMTLACSGAVFAFSPSFDRQPLHEDQEAIQQAIENGDFEAWKSLMEARLTEEEFQAMTERHNQMSEGQGEMQQVREQIREAIEAGDTDLAQELKDQLPQRGFNKEPGMNSGECPFAN